MKWKPFNTSELRECLSEFEGWFLDGGHALDLFAGVKTRDHEDIDVGIFSDKLDHLISHLQVRGFEIFKADGSLKIVKSIDNDFFHSYWVSDQKAYKFQILVYKKLNGSVVFRRNADISWPEESFLLFKNGLSFVNPLVIYTFKITAKEFRQKDPLDINTLLKIIQVQHA